MKSFGSTLSFFTVIVVIPDKFPALSFAWNDITFSPSLCTVIVFPVPLIYVFSSSVGYDSSVTSQ